MDAYNVYYVKLYIPLRLAPAAGNQISEPQRLVCGFVLNRARLFMWLLIWSATCVADRVLTLSPLCNGSRGRQDIQHRRRQSCGAPGNRVAGCCRHALRVCCDRPTGSGFDVGNLTFGCRQTVLSVLAASLSVQTGAVLSIR